jgi:hypothetical protein
VKERAGWRLIEADAVAIPAHSSWPVNGASRRARRKVVLVPVLAAGLEGNRSVTEELSDSEIGHHLTHPSVALPEYRTLLSVEWSNDRDTP